MRQILPKAAAAGFLLFLALWIAGTVRGFALPYPEPPVFDFSAFDRLANAQQANANNLRQIGLSTTALPLVLDKGDVEQIQVYERIASLTSATRTFDDDEGQVRSAIAGHQGTIFHEVSSGLTPDRTLTLDIGVSPEKFDALLAELKQIGKFENIRI